ncbi:MAG: hypothetical protein M3Q48_01240 [Actinomycetota bacterium]|nr:hypothetical protein [Actinomycetota bacterium]
MLLLAAVVISRFPGGAAGSGGELEPSLPPMPEIERPVVQAPECSRPGPFSKVCGNINSLGGDLIEYPGMTDRLTRPRIVITPEGRVRFEAKLRRKGDSLGSAAADYDDTFERYGWLLDPGSPPAGTLVEPRTEITRHYVGISTVPPPGKDSVANKGFEATLHLQQVPASAGGPGDVLVEAFMQTIEPVAVPRQGKR